MTMLGITFLHGIIKRSEAKKVGEILNLLRERIKEIFISSGKENLNGLDIALCVVDTETNILSYSGAYNPLYIIRENKLIEIKAVRNPIGFYPKEKKFITHKIQLHNNDMIYLFSDGYQDQFSAIKKRKFTKKRFKKLIEEICNLPTKEQKNILEERLQNWKGDTIQIDDITIMGVKCKIK